MFQCSRCLKKYGMDEFAALKIADGGRYCLCGRQFRKDRWRLRTAVGSNDVSTVHTETSQFDSEDEVWYETMIYDNENKVWRDFQARYADEQHARIGHKIACETLAKMAKEPGKYTMETVYERIRENSAQGRDGRGREKKEEIV